MNSLGSKISAEDAGWEESTDIPGKPGIFQESTMSRTAINVKKAVMPAEITNAVINPMINQLIEGVDFDFGFTPGVWSIP